MPLIYKEQINARTKLGVWLIEESEDFFSGDDGPARVIRHPQKRLQHLAGRFLLKELHPDFPLSSISLNPANKPVLEEAIGLHFSLSHCRNYAAAIISESRVCGVDVEAVEEKIIKVAHKFLSTEEREIIANQISGEKAMLTFAWSIKEAAFKWYGRRAVDFLNDMKIITVASVSRGWRTELFFGKEVKAILYAESRYLENNILSYILQ